MNQTSDSQPEPKRGWFGRRRKDAHPVPASEQTPPEVVEDTCNDPNCLFHGQGAVAMPFVARVPFPQTLGDILRQAAKQGTASSAPSPVSRAWSPMFADKISTGDLVGVPAGMFGRSERELKVCEIREHAGNSEDPLAPYRTLLLMDTTSGEVFSPTVSAHQGFRVAPAVPDSPAFLGGA